MGYRKTTDFIEKTTWGLAIALAILSVVCAHVVPTSSTEQSVIEKVATEQSQTNPNNLPGFGASQTKQNNTAAPADKPAAAPAEQKAAN
jgi:preprotein translocase subunit SecG